MNIRTSVIALGAASSLSLAGLALPTVAHASTPSSPTEVAERVAANEQQLDQKQAQMTANAEARAKYEAAVEEHAQKLKAWRAVNMAGEQAEMNYEQAMAAYRAKYGNVAVSGTY